MDTVKPSALAVACKRAKLTQKEVALILRVSLITAHKFLHGYLPSAAFLPRVEVATNAITAFISRNDLPLPYKTTGEGKVKRADMILRLRCVVDVLLDTKAEKATVL